MTAPQPSTTTGEGPTAIAPVVTPDSSKMCNDLSRSGIVAYIVAPSPVERSTVPLVSSSSSSISSQSGPLMIGIAGGTASGKTEIAMEIASQLNLHEDLEVVSATLFPLSILIGMVLGHPSVLLLQGC